MANQNKNTPEIKSLGERLRGMVPTRTNILKWLSLTYLIYGELDKRLEIDEAVQKQLHKPVAHHVKWYHCLGGIAMFFFIVQVISGILLTVYYKPSEEEAFASVQYIINHVTLGWLIREVHAWGANLMIACIILHMAKVFITGSFKPPREFNWVVGCLLLAITLVFGFSGYLLPWDQVAFHATAVGTSTVKELPLIGETMLVVLRGGEEVSGATLSRFFSLHVMVLPWVMVGLLTLHFVMVRRQGISGPL